MAERLHARVEYIDLFRAFGILLMIMGHIKFGSHFDQWIHGFHMPMFFFISGWFFKRRDQTGPQIRKKARTLLLPYLVFELTQWLLLMPFVPEYRTPRVLLSVFALNTSKIPVESGTYGISPIPGAMWFLTAIFFAELLYILLDRLLDRGWKLHAAVAVLVVLGMAAPSVLPVRLPWALDAAFVGLGFFHIARIARGTKAEKLLDLKFWQAAVLGAAITVSILVFPKINMRTGAYGWYLPFWLNALGAIVAGWNLSRYLERFLCRGGFLQTVSAWLKGIGKNSIIYLCWNQTVILAVTKGLDLLGVHGVLAKLPILVLTMLILFGLEKLFFRTRLRGIVGK